MRCAVPSSKIGSCDSAKAAAERDSGVDAAAGLIGVACATGVAAPAGAGVAGLAGAGAVPELTAPAFWPNAGATASIVAMATMVILRMSEALGMRCDGAGVKSTSSLAEAERTGWEAVRNRIFANLACEGCILIKLVLRLLRCRNAQMDVRGF